MYEKTTTGRFAGNSFINLITESSARCNPFCPRSNILAKCPTAIILATVAGVTKYMIVRLRGIELVTPHGLLSFCDERCATGYYVSMYSPDHKAGTVSDAPAFCFQTQKSPNSWCTRNERGSHPNVQCALLCPLAKDVPPSMELQECSTCWTHRAEIEN